MNSNEMKPETGRLDIEALVDELVGIRAWAAQRVKDKVATAFSGADIGRIEYQCEEQEKEAIDKAWKEAGDRTLNIIDNELECHLTPRRLQAVKDNDFAALDVLNMLTKVMLSERKGKLNE